MSKEKKSNALLLRMDNATKQGLQKQADKIDRSLNWYVVNLIQKDLKLKDA